jgi:hypothetical protein
MANTRSTPFSVLVALLVFAFGLPSAASAQDGPGGVEDTTGTSNLQIWLRADEGVSPTTDGSTVTDWTNQGVSGNPTTVGAPTYVLDGLNARPVVRFDDGDGIDEFDFGSLSNFSDGENTLIAVSSNAGSPFDQLNQSIISFGDFAQNTGAPQDARGLIYYLDAQTGGDQILLAALSGDGRQRGGPNVREAAETTTYNVAPFSIFSSVVDEADDEQDLIANGSILDGTGPARTGSYDANGTSVGYQLTGDVAEVIAIDRQVNAAELTIIYNYLSAKYNISLQGSIADVYGFDDSYNGDIAGVGRSSGPIGKAPDGAKAVAQSSGLRVNRESQLNGGGEYLLFGHDQANLAFTTVERPNGLTEDIQKFAREWRVDLTGQSSVNSLTLGFDETVLNQSTLSNSETLANSTYNDYFLYVDDDGDFSSGATRYDLEPQGNGLYTTPDADVQIDDGDYVTVARIQRTITFDQTFNNDFENANGGSGYGVSVTANLNFPNSTSISANYTVNGVTKTIDGTSTVAPVEGSGNDFTASAASFSFSAGSTSDTQTAFTVLNDGENESTTEFIQVGLGDLSAEPVVEGTPSQFEFGIIDDENSRPVSFDSGNPTEVDEGNGGVKPQTFTLTLPSGETGPTTVLYRVTGTATAGEDYEIASASSSTATTGEVSFASGSETATFDINVLTDQLDEGSDETFTITLIGATDATLGGPPVPSLTFTIDDDDPTPEVTFKSTNFTGEEGQSAAVIVELDGPAGRDLDVAVKDQQSGSATAGSDYTTFNDLNGDTAIVTVPAGETEASASLSLLTDGQVEETETVNLIIDTDNTDPPVADANNPPTATVSILDASGLGATGPGGVGDASSLALWLRGDDGITTSGSGVSEWADQSGNGNDAAQNDTGEQPSTGASINGINVVSFDGTDDFLRTNVESLPGSPHTLFSVSQATGGGAVFGIDDGSFNSVRTLEYTGASTAAASQDGSTTGGAGTASPSVLASEFDGSNVSIAVDGGSPTTTGASANSDGVYALVGGEGANDGDQQQPILGAENAFDGDLGELIAYSTTLNAAQDSIVTNYLKAKYAIDTQFSDLYNDAGADGMDGNADDRDTDVVGVGQASNGDKHFRARGGGLELSVAGSADNGDFVLAGRKIGVDQRINVSDVGGVTDLTARLNDDRYFDVTGTLNVDVTFDFDEFGVVGPAGDVSNYVLIRRDTDGSGGWEEVSTSASVSGDRVTFPNVTLENADDGYFTIGTTSSATSPLDARFTAISGQAGTAPNNTGSNSNGADAGYVDLGLPITGGQVNSLVRFDRTNGGTTSLFTSTNLGRTGLNSSTGILYTWDYASQQYNVVTDPTTNLPNGEGFTVWIKDSPEFPVDPELNFGLEDLSNEPTSNVTVDVSGGGDTGRYVFLANPYLSAYDMTAFTDLTANNFQATIAAWDRNNGGQFGSYDIITQGASDDNISRYQGFFLERQLDSNGNPVPGGTSFTFDVTGKVTGQNEPLIGAKSATETKSAEELVYRKLGLKLSVFDDSGNKLSQDVGANVFFTDRADAAWDAYDAPKYRPPSTRFATIAPMGTGRDGSEVPKSQESLPYTPDGAVEIPLELSVKNLDGTFELSAREFESIPKSWNVVLVDNQGPTVQLTRSNPSYPFEVSSSKAAATKSASRTATGKIPMGPNARMTKASSSPRFYLRIEPSDEVLPVDLAGMDATADGRDVVVSWKTASETGNAGFAVEHKREDGSFEKVGFVDGRGTTQKTQQYRYRVEDLNYGTHTFRLRQVDTDGSERYSKEVSAKLRLNESHLVGDPYPNPTRRKSTLEVTVRESQDVRVEMYDLLGRRVRVLHDDRIEAQRTRRFEVRANRLASGHYFVRVIGKNFVETRRLTLVK